MDTSPFGEDEDLTEKESEYLSKFKKVFINAKILKEEGDEWAFNEGCLSIPGITEDVFRHEKITVEYFDENFEKHTEVIDGMAARVIQHEYDHIEGVLFIDKIASLTRRLIKKRLENISKGLVDTDYKMKFPFLKKR
ncbi:MAG: peptide deformylase [Lutibacter sp.]